jgi:hypothetical protein
MNMQRSRMGFAPSLRPLRPRLLELTMFENPDIAVQNTASCMREPDSSCCIMFKGDRPSSAFCSSDSLSRRLTRVLTLTRSDFRFPGCDRLLRSVFKVMHTATFGLQLLHRCLRGVDRSSSSADSAAPATAHTPAGFLQVDHICCMCPPFALTA